MGAITIRNLSDDTIAAIKRHAAERGISMEEEVRRLLASLYSEDRQKRGQEWAEQQLGRLRRGELPKADISSVEEIRAMRRHRTDELARRSQKTR
jgi:plasmid stability protein